MGWFCGFLGLFALLERCLHPAAAAGGCGSVCWATWSPFRMRPGVGSTRSCQRQGCSGLGSALPSVCDHMKQTGL